jgi:hypothetical protein
VTDWEAVVVRTMLQEASPSAARASAYCQRLNQVCRTHSLTVTQEDGRRFRIELIAWEDPTSKEVSL